jgi:Domain of unknown function (DUF4062)
MAKTQTILRVFVASPSDVASERKTLEGVINEINLTLADINKTRLELIKWETHSQPSFGDGAQDVINKQLGDDCDIFLGIMWGQFGSPTKRAQSGTEEEFERAYSRWNKSPGSVEIMFYFKDAGIKPSESDPEQLNKVVAFKQRISSECGGLYHEFDTLEEFRKKTHRHLSRLAQSWQTRPKAAEITKVEIDQTSIDTINPLANLLALDDGDDDGVFELVEKVEEALNMVVGTVGKISEATNELGKKMQLRAKEMDMLSGEGIRPDRKKIKKASNNVAADIELFVNKISIEIPKFHEQNSTAMDTYRKIAIIAAADFEESSDDIQQGLDQIQEYREAIISSQDGLSEMRESAVGLPNMTTAFNRARKRAVAVIGDLLEMLRLATKQAEGVEKLLSDMI